MRSPERKQQKQNACSQREPSTCREARDTKNKSGTTELKEVGHETVMEHTFGSTSLQRQLATVVPMCSHIIATSLWPGVNGYNDSGFLRGGRNILRLARLCPEAATGE
jgi:hypothetical protein